MAKFGVYYSLCPLIDHRSLLGITPDVESGVVIVTLGKNIAIKYKLLDQKQLHSWRTKEKFTSPIIYDTEHKQYVGIFNETYIRVWSGNEEFVDKLKKFKLKKQIYTIFCCNNLNFIVFQNGSVYLLNEAIDNRKDLDPVDVINTENEVILDILHINLKQDVYVGLLIKSGDDQYLLWTKFTESSKLEKFSKISLKRDQTYDLNGYVFHADNNSVHFLTLWSDGRILSTTLQDSDLDVSNPGDLFTVIEQISYKHHISMVSLNENYIAMYGGNYNEEGALLIIYNVQFKVVQSRQEFKLFTLGARLTCIDNNLYLPVGQNLAVIPFHLDTEQLAALVGTHRILESDPDILIINKVQFADWGFKAQESSNPIPETINDKVLELISQGLPENLICQELVSELIEKQDIAALKDCLQYFSDVPESSLVQLLKFFINLDCNLFKKSQKASKDLPARLQPLKKAKLIDLILIREFNEASLNPSLRLQLDLDEVLLILQYICYLFSENGHLLNNMDIVDTEKHLINWGCAVLDANYQKLLLTKDENILQILERFNNLVCDELKCLDDLNTVVPLIDEINNGRSIYKNVNRSKYDYTIEPISLY